MTTRYVYIDDEPQVGAGPIVDAVLRRNDELQIEQRQPEAFAADLRETLGSRPNGLILDLRLDLVAGAAGQSADYRAPSFAQEVRTRAAEGIIPSMPIVLWSTQVNLSNSFTRDGTAQDLFDLTYSKEDVARDPGRVAAELVALAAGYEDIREALHVKEDQAIGIMRAILALAPEQPLDDRISGRFAGKELRTPVQDYARFVMSEVISEPGPLLDEGRVAAVCGVARESKDWTALRDLLEGCRYKGVFSSMRLRWWRAAIDGWWLSLRRDLRPIRSLPAGERVAVIRDATKLELVPARGIAPGYSDRFSTICEATGGALDPVDGFRLRGKDPLPWQEPRFISKDAALERTGYADRGLRVHPLERERFEELVRSIMPSEPNKS